MKVPVFEQLKIDNSEGIVLPYDIFKTPSTNRFRIRYQKQLALSNGQFITPPSPVPAQVPAFGSSVLVDYHGEFTRFQLVSDYDNELGPVSSD